MSVAQMEKEKVITESPAPGKFTQHIGTYIALTTAIMAALAGISSLLMARHSGKATSQLIQSSNYWSYYQSKSLKSYILTSEAVMLRAMGKPQGEKEAAKLAELEAEKAQIKKQAEDATALSQLYGKYSHTLADAVTLFQIAIANAAIAALSKKPPFWFISVGLGLIGIGFMIYYVIQSSSVIA